MLVTYLCLLDPVNCWYFAGNIAALTVRFHQGMVSGKSVSHRQASFSMFFACCVAVQQDARGLSL